MICRRTLAGTLALAGLLVGCSAHLDEVQSWAEVERRAAKPTVKPLDPPKRFDPQAYEAAASVDPFSAQKLNVASKQDTGQPNPLLAAEMNRRREPLEAFPLDSMVFVGSMQRKEGRYAILRIDNLLYHVHAGEHIGQNFGRILKISETELSLREVVQDSTGDWVERISTLQLQETGR